MNAMLIRIQRIRGQIPSEDRNPCLVYWNRIYQVYNSIVTYDVVFTKAYIRPQRFKNLTEECFLWRCCSGLLSSEEG